MVVKKVKVERSKDSVKLLCAADVQVIEGGAGKNSQQDYSLELDLVRATKLYADLKLALAIEE